MSIPAIPKDYYGHKTELFLDNLCNQESDNLRDHKQLEVRNNFPKRKKLLYVYCKSGLEKFLNPLFFAFLQKIHEFLVGI